MDTKIELSVERDADGKIIEVFFDGEHEKMSYEALSNLTHFVNQANENRPWKLIKGTEFQQKVWLELAKIPVGQTITYQEMAIRIGSPKAQQAVGQALSQNPLPVILPCQRVTKKDGTLGGFMGKDARMDIKQAILDFESGQVSLF